jgi:hypothetical protein
MVAQAPTTAQAVFVVHDDGTTVAYGWGFEDSTGGIDRRGSWYWWPGSWLWRQYHAGYNAGVAQLLAGLNWNQDFSDVVAAEDRDDWIGA